MANDRLIVAELDAENLQNQGLLGPGDSTGSARIHKRRLNRSSEEEYGDIPLDVYVNSPNATNAFATIPVMIVSYDTLLYLGLSADKASHIWSEWTHWPATGPRREVDLESGGIQVTFIDFITARLRNYEDVYEDNDYEWRQCLTLCGMCQSVQDAIMDPTFNLVRLTNSCVFWVRDTLLMRYAGLEDIGRASRQREMELVRTVTRPGGIGSGAGISGESWEGRRGVNIQQGRSTKAESSSQGRRSVSGLQQQTTPGISSMLWSPNTSIEKKPEHIVLFKGIDQGRITGLFNETGEVQDIETLLSSPPSDFSGTRSLFYFTPDQKVAEYYAAYAKRRANCESVVMVCLSIPKIEIDNLEADTQYLYWPTPQWKQLVWRCKQPKSLPKPLRKYRDAFLIIGTISKGAQRVFKNLQTWEEMTNACVLYVPSSNQSNPAVQYVFSGQEEGCEFLTQHGKIEVFPFSEAAIQALVVQSF